MKFYNIVFTLLFLMSGCDRGSAPRDDASGPVYDASGNVLVKPFADAGEDQEVTIGETVSLDGNNSLITASPTLSYQWKILSKPSTSLITINEETSQKATFIPDIEGEYLLELKTNNGYLSSNPSLVNIVASTPKHIRMAFDLNTNKVIVNWKDLANVPDNATAYIKTFGVFGTFFLDKENLTYTQTDKKMLSDKALLTIQVGSKTFDVNITANGPQWAQVSTGKDYTVGIKHDGTLWSWGSNNYGQLGDATNSDSVIAVRESSHVNTWKYVVSGGDYTVAIKEDGSLWSWGLNNKGQLGDNSNNNSNVPVREASTGTNWERAISGGDYTVALTEDGVLWSWGSNSDGKLGNNSNINSTVPVREDSTSTWKSVASGGSFTVALKEDGSIWSWGANYSGQLGDKTNTSSAIPINEDSHNRTWKSIACGNDYTLGIREDGTLWSWGSNSYGQLGDSTNDNRNIPVQESSSVNNWKNVVSGGTHTTAIREDGTLWSWGSNSYGQLGNASNMNSNFPIREDTHSSTWKSVMNNEENTVGIQEDGTLWSWGYNSYGQLGDTTLTSSDIPLQEIGKSIKWVSVKVGKDFTAGMKQDGSLWMWGNDSNGQLGRGAENGYYLSTTSTALQVVQTDVKWKSVVKGDSYTVALKEDGTLWSWGNNQFGQLGTGTNESSGIPIQEISLSLWKTIFSGGMYTMAIKEDGTLWSWGNNSSGTLGDGSRNNSNIPVQENSKSKNWKKMTSGGDYTIALKEDGTLWSWGSNYYGKLGNNSNEESYDPVQEASKSTMWRSVVSGGSHTVAVKEDGTLWSWGSNNFYQLGNNSNHQSESPVQESSHSTQWKLAVAQDRRTTAVKYDGTIWSWGANLNEQGGSGSNDVSATPVQERSNTTTWVTLEAGDEHIIAIQENNTLWLWGSNYNGELGNGYIGGTVTYPTQEVTYTTSWKKFVPGNDFTLAIKKDGTLWGWGDNFSGQLGDGTTSSRSQPRQEVTHSSFWQDVATNGSSVMAIQEDGTLWGWGNNNSQQLGYSTKVPGQVRSGE